MYLLLFLYSILCTSPLLVWTRRRGKFCDGVGIITTACHGACRITQTDKGEDDQNTAPARVCACLHSTLCTTATGCLQTTPSCLHEDTSKVITEGVISIKISTSGCHVFPDDLLLSALCSDCTPRALVGINRGVQNTGWYGFAGSKSSGVPSPIGSTVPGRREFCSSDHDCRSLPRLPCFVPMVHGRQ